jgi:hypothetical protein
MTPLAQHAAVILAQLAAQREVRRRIQREGRVPLSTLSHATISRLANDLVEACPRLIVEAAADPIVVQMSQVTHRKRSPAAQGLPVCKSHERNGGPQQ